MWQYFAFQDSMTLTQVQRLKKIILFFFGGFPIKGRQESSHQSPGIELANKTNAAVRWDYPSG